MKKIWKIILLVVGVIGAIFLLVISPAAGKIKFKKLVRKKEEEVDEVKEKIKKVDVDKKVTKEKIKKQSTKIKKSKDKVKNTKKSKDTLDDFEKKYRNKKK